MTVEVSRAYLPAAGHDWLLPLYDPIVKLLGGESARMQLLEQASLQSGQRVLDVGCGTGTMATRIKQLHPQIEIVGIDPDPKALARARRKASRASVTVQFDQGFADSLPYPAESFDRVVSSFVFHHLPAEVKLKALVEMRRVLNPAGELHLADFEGPEDHHQGLLARLLHSNHHLHDNSEHRVLDLMQQAGFSNARKTGRRRMGFGSVAYYRAV